MCKFPTLLFRGVLLLVQSFFSDKCSYSGGALIRLLKVPPRDRVCITVKHLLYGKITTKPITPPLDLTHIFTHSQAK